MFLMPQLLVQLRALTICFSISDGSRFPHNIILRSRGRITLDNLGFQVLHPRRYSDSNKVELYDPKLVFIYHIGSVIELLSIAPTINTFEIIYIVSGQHHDQFSRAHS